MKKIRAIIFVVLLLGSIFLPSISVSAFSREVFDFDKIWYHPTIGFNKNGDGQLIMAVTYTNNSFRLIDYASFTYRDDPFYLRIAFSDELTVIRDPDGNIIYEEPKDGYIYLKKDVVDNHMPEDIKKLASKGFTYKTITYDGDLWYRISVPNFNRAYEWKEYVEPIADGSWHTWGSDKSIQFETKPMFIELLSESTGSLLFDFNRPGDNSGQQIIINGTYLRSKGIFNPVFEWMGTRLSYTTTNETTYYWNETVPHYIPGYWGNGIWINETWDNETYSLYYPAHWRGDIWVPEYWENGTIPHYIPGYWENQTWVNGTWDNETVQYSVIDATYIINPEHFSRIGIHEEATGEMYTKIIADTYTEKLIGQQTVYDSGKEVTSVISQTFREKIDAITNISVYLGNDVGMSVDQSIRIRDIDDVIISTSSSVSIPDGIGAWYTFEFITDVEIDFNTTYKMQLIGTGNNFWWYQSDTDTYANGSASWDSGKDADFKIYGYRQTYDGSRSYSDSTEVNLLDVTAVSVYTGAATIKMPVSYSVKSITEVRNNTGGSKATSVDNYGLLVNNTYWYDSANQFVYVRTIDLSNEQSVDWSVNDTWGANANISFPRYKDVGEDVHLKGMITDSDGIALHEHTASCNVYFENGSLALGPYDWNCTGGNFEMTFSTTTLPAGIYGISISFTDPISGFVYSFGETLYLGVDPPVDGGIYVQSKLHFNFYNNNTGFGIPIENLIVYADNEIPLTSTDRLYAGIFNTYTGEIIYYNVTDYFGNVIYNDSVTITSREQWIDIPIDWYSFGVKNMNHSIVHFKMTDYSFYAPESNGWQVDANSDDIGVRDSDTSVYIATVSGDYSAANYDYATGLRFLNLNIPQGYEIVSANLTLMAEEIYGGIPETFIEGEDIDDSPTFSTYADYVGRDRTTASVSWTPSGWSIGTWYTSSDISSVIQEIVNRPGWESGNDLSLFWRDAPGYGGQKWLEQERHDNVPAEAAKLNITWRESAPIIGDRTYSRHLYPYEPFYWDVLEGTYSINLTYIDPDTDVIVDYSQENITITGDTYYWIRGYDLQDIIFEITLVNTSLDSLSISITADITAINSTVNSITTNILSSLTLSESNITTLVNSYASNYTIIESLITHLNNTIWANFTIVESVIDTINNKLTIDFGILNTTIDYINNTVWMNFDAMHSNMSNVTVNIRSSLTFTESNLTTLNNYIWNAINITDSTVDFLNNNIWNEFNYISNNISWMNSTTTYVNDTIWNNFTIVGEDITILNISIHNAIDLSELNLTALNINIWNDFNITDAIIGYLNNTIWNNFTIVDANIDNINNKLTINFDMLNVTVDYINNTIWTEFTAVNSNIDTVKVSMINAISLSESNITTLNNNIWNAINITDSIVDYLNLSVWNNFTAIGNEISSLNISFVDTVTLAENNITSLQLSFWGDINATLKNRSLVMFNFYNTNDGLGLGWDILRVYINGARATDRTYWCMNGTEINVTVKDYYNFTLRTDTFTINAPFESLDLGLSFHSWLFGNKNDDYYMLSFLKEGASRWYERGIVPYGEREYMLPSGNYTMRIYDKDWNEIHNSTYVMNRSMVYVIHGRNLSEIIAGQSVISGQLLELSGTLADALMPDVTIISRNPTMVFSVYDTEGMSFGNNFYGERPSLITIATTRVTTYGNWINSTPAIPGNNSVLNGTVTILRDILYMSGNASWVNITCHNDNTLNQNYSYVPTRLDTYYGGNLTINASDDITVYREIQFNQRKTLTWENHPFVGDGPDPERAGYHSIGFEVQNRLSVPLYDVYVLAGFSDISTIDGSSLFVRDTANDVILKRMINYDITKTNIHFYILAIDANNTRGFTTGYYDLPTTSYIYDEATVTVNKYEQTVWQDLSFNTFKVQWTNNFPGTFKGAIYIDIYKALIPMGIKTVRIWDIDNDHEIDSGKFIIGDEFIRIGSAAVGEVAPGGMRNFDVYFLMDETAGSDPKEMHLTTQIFWGITPFLLILLAGICCIIIGIALLALDKKNKDRWKVCVSLGIFIIVVTMVLQAMGL